MNTRNLLAGVGLLCLGIAAGVAIDRWSRVPAVKNAPASHEATRAPTAAPATGGKRRILYWANAMNPSIHSSHPMKDSMGMAYVPVYASRTGSSGASRPDLQIDPRMVANLGVRLVSAQRKRLGHTVQTVGTVSVDENRVYAVTPRFSGWVERLDVRAVGDPVHRGEVLARIYSPQLYSTEQEFLIAQHSTPGPGGKALLAAVRSRLQLLGMTDTQIDALARRGSAARDVPLLAPASGVIMAMHIRQGGYAGSRNTLYRIANLDRVWVKVALYSYQLPWVQPGDPVRLHLASEDGRIWQGRLNFLYPTLNPRDRTVTARLSFRNPGDVLRPGMYATATIVTRPREALAVPGSAVLRTGQGNYVLLAQGAGHFLPVQVSLGPQTDGWVEIRKGLNSGDRVVDSAQFLLYSESQFQSVKARLLGGNTVSGSAAAKPGAAPADRISRPRKPGNAAHASQGASMPGMSMPAPGGADHD
ncbi:MAG: efflux RND transporter periplasmic adaptor subunit [Acidiferrobacterales bacterium]